jgi:hypothetical protein
VSTYQRPLEKHKEDSSSGRAELKKMQAQYKLLAIDLLADADSGSGGDTAHRPLLSSSTRRMVCLSACCQGHARFPILTPPTQGDLTKGNSSCSCMESPAMPPSRSSAPWLQEQQRRSLPLCGLIRGRCLGPGRMSDCWSVRCRRTPYASPTNAPPCRVNALPTDPMSWQCLLSSVVTALSTVSVTFSVAIVGMRTILSSWL